MVVFSSGNESNSSVSYPSSLEEVISVGSVGALGDRSVFSNYGNGIEIVAPGENIYTIDRIGNYGYSSGDYCFNFSGTSTACPHVSGVAAIILSLRPELLSWQVRKIMDETAQKVGNYNYQTLSGHNFGTWNNEVGYGLVDAYAAVIKAIGIHPDLCTRAAFDALHARGYKIIATLPHENDVMLADLDISQPTAIVFGTELTGLSQTAIDLADGYVKIPMYGFTESFNISVSAALCTFYLTEKMRSTPGLDWHLSPDEQMDVKLNWARQSIRDANRLMKKLAADLGLPEILI